MSKPSVPLVAVMLASLGLGWAPVASAKAEETIRLRDGASCVRSESAQVEGETHQCFFAQGVFRKRDFQNHNSRAEYVFSALERECDEIELLGTNAYQPADGTKPLHRVSVACTK